MQALRTLPSTVWMLGFVSLLNDSASEMIYPLVPLYLSAVLMAGPRTLGLIEGLAEATASLLKLFSGVVVDRTRRTRPWLVIGYGLATVGRPLIAVTTSWVGLLVIRLSDRIGKGLRSSPRDALLAASIAPSQRGLAFGLHRALDNAGAVVGPLTAAILLGFGVPLQHVFVIALLPGLLALGLTLALKEPDRAAAGPLPARAPFDWRLRDLPVPYRRYLAAVALFTLGNASNMFLLLRARELGLPEAQVPLLWAAVSFIAAVLSTPLSAWSDRIGRSRLITAGWTAYGLFYLGMGLAPRSGAVLLVLFACYGIFMAATEGVEKALVADIAPPERRGTAYGWFNLVSGACLLPASAIFGVLYESIGPASAFAFSAACAFGAAALLRSWVRVPVASPPSVDRR